MGKYCSNCLADRIGGRSGKKSLAVYTTMIFPQEWWWIAGLSRAGAIAEAQMQYTPENERLEPKDDGLEEEFPFQQWRCLMIFGVHVSFPGILLVKVGSWLSEESQLRKKDIRNWPQQCKKKQPQHQVHPINNQSEKSKETANQISWGNKLCVSGSNWCYHVMHALDTWYSSHFRLDATLIDILTGWIVVKIDWLVAGS